MIDRIIIQKIYVLPIWIIAVCLPLTKAGVSIGILMLFLVLFFKTVRLKNARFSPFHLTFILFFLPFLSFFWSINKEQWLDHLVLKLPFLVFALAYITRYSISRKDAEKALHGYAIGCILSTAVIVYNYVFDKASIINAMAQGHHLNHWIRIPQLGFLLAIGAFIFLYFLHRYKVNNLRTTIYFVSLLFLAFGLHLLGARLGLLVFYVTIFYWSGLFFKMIWSRVIVLFGLMSLVLFAYYTIDSFHQKVHYSMYDIHQTLRGQGQNYSDGERLISCQLGIQASKENWIIGHGAGDLWDTMNRLYRKNSPGSKKIILPHNQFITWFAYWGILGFWLIMYGLIRLCMQLKHRTSKILASFWLLYFLIENPLEELTTMTLFCIMILLLDTRYPITEVQNLS